MDAKEAEKQREVYDFVDDVNDILSMRKRHIARYLSQHEFFRELPRNLKI
ncbi:hypothetical protein KC711_00745 [Candidatus Peregrinibacteria bacterium]|nr:hypothetical protein [Candidatus Peregrinibacteria bacterium]MCB9804739.1 hypothetical protein [Candidatus Peribacteria bacterium]